MARSERALRREGLYGAPLEGPGMELPAVETWPERMPVRVGTSGWAYRHWLGRVYPRRLPGPQLLPHFARRFPSVEVNSTYYRLPEPRVVDAWREAVPPGFRFVVKAPGSITHDKRLRDVEEETTEFLNLCGRLRDRLGLVLFQLPPGLHVDLEALDDLLALVPRDVRPAVELRHRSWFEPEVYALLARRGAAFVVHDYGSRGSPIVATAPHVYLRLHGPSGRYRGAYPHETLLQWAEQVRAWRRDGRETWVFFNNDERGKAVHDALALRAHVEQDPLPAPPRVPWGAGCGVV